MTTDMKSPTDNALDDLVVSLDLAESALATLRKHSTRLEEYVAGDGHIPAGGAKGARVAALDAVEAAQSAGKCLRTLEALSQGEPCS